MPCRNQLPHPQHQAGAQGTASPTRLSGTCLPLKRLGNGSSQATAKGAGAQPRSLDSSPTHGCPALGGQGTGSLWCDPGQVSNPAPVWGRGCCPLGPCPCDCPPSGSLSLACCLYSPLCLRLCLLPALPLLPLAGSLFLFLFAFLSISVCLYSYLGLCPTDSSPTSAPSRGRGDLPHPRHTFQPPPPPGCPSLEPAATVLGAQDGASGLRLGQRLGCGQGL